MLVSYRMLPTLSIGQFNSRSINIKYIKHPCIHRPDQQGITKVTKRKNIWTGSKPKGPSRHETTRRRLVACLCNKKLHVPVTCVDCRLMARFYECSLINHHRLILLYGTVGLLGQDGRKWWRPVDIVSGCCCCCRYYAQKTTSAAPFVLGSQLAQLQTTTRMPRSTTTWKSL